MTREPDGTAREREDERDDERRQDDAGGGDLRRGAEPADDETSQFGGPEGGQPTGS